MGVLYLESFYRKSCNWNSLWLKAASSLFFFLYHALQGFSGFNYIARELGLGNETFDHTRTILETFNTTCAKMNSNAKIINDSCFSGLFIAHMMEVGFGMNNASQNWTLVFKDHDKVRQCFVDMTYYRVCVLCLRGE